MGENNCMLFKICWLSLYVWLSLPLSLSLSPIRAYNVRVSICVLIAMRQLWL